MGLDQIHEQSSAVIKGMGGATSSLDKVDQSSLARWGLCIHEWASIVSEYKFEENDMNSPHEAQRHHEDSPMMLTVLRRLFLNVGEAHCPEQPR